MLNLLKISKIKNFHIFVKVDGYLIIQKFGMTFERHKNLKFDFFTIQQVDGKVGTEYANTKFTNYGL